MPDSKRTIAPSSVVVLAPPPSGGSHCLALQDDVKPDFAPVLRWQGGLAGWIGGYGISMNNTQVVTTRTNYSRSNASNRRFRVQSCYR